MDNNYSSLIKLKLTFIPTALAGQGSAIGRVRPLFPL